MDEARESELAAQGYRDAHPGNPECTLCSGRGKYFDREFGAIVSCVPCVMWIEQKGIKLPFKYAPECDCDGESFGTDHFIVDADGKEVTVAPNGTVGLVFAAAFDLRAALETLVAGTDKDGIEKARAAINKSYGRQ